MLEASASVGETDGGKERAQTARWADVCLRPVGISLGPFRVPRGQLAGSGDIFDCPVSRGLDAATAAVHSLTWVRLLCGPVDHSMPGFPLLWGRGGA